MKKVFAIIASLITLSAPATMQAREGVYAGVIGGVNFLEAETHSTTLEMRTGYLAGIIGGYEWCGGVSTEVEITYRHNDIRRVKFHGIPLKPTPRGGVGTWSYMGNLYYDLPICWCLKPYLGAGLGYDFVRTSSKTQSFKVVSKRDCVSYQFMAGVTYELCNSWDLAAEYKFHQGYHRDDNHAITLGVFKSLECFNFDSWYF